MGEVLKIELPVDEDIASAIQAAIADGEYHDLGQLVSESLIAWHDERLNRNPQYIERLRRLVQDGLDSGEPIEGGFDVEDIRRRGVERLRREGKI